MVRDILEGVGWVILGAGAGFFFVISLLSGSAVQIIVSSAVLAVVGSGLFFALRRQRERALRPAGAEPES